MLVEETHGYSAHVRSEVATTYTTTRRPGRYSKITSDLGHYSFTHIQSGLIGSNSMAGLLPRSSDIAHGIGQEGLGPTVNRRGLNVFTLKVCLE